MAIRARGKNDRAVCKSGVIVMVVGFADAQSERRAASIARSEFPWKGGDCGGIGALSARRGTPVPSAIRNGRAHRLHVERIENRTPVREPVNVRRADVLPAIEAAVGKAKVVNEQEDDVWFSTGLRVRCTGRREECREQDRSESEKLRKKPVQRGEHSHPARVPPHFRLFAQSLRRIVFIWWNQPVPRPPTRAFGISRQSRAPP